MATEHILNPGIPLGIHKITVLKRSQYAVPFRAEDKDSFQVMNPVMHIYICTPHLGYIRGKFALLLALNHQPALSVPVLQWREVLCSVLPYSWIHAEDQPQGCRYQGICPYGREHSATQNLDEEICTEQVVD